MKYAVMVLAVLMMTVSLSLAGVVKDYQVTGPVLEVKDDMVVVEKGKEKWEIAKDKDTKVTGDLKVGSKVTVQYKMKASSIEAKGGEAKKETKAAPKK